MTKPILLSLTLAATAFTNPAFVVAQDQQVTPALTAKDTREPLRYPFDNETPAQREARFAWWREAKFGMFIHWGIYAIPADGEWHMKNKKKSFAEYSRYAGQFNPVKFDADQWMAIAQDAGMKYLVITAKHHDGFAMFDSKASDYNIVKATPFKRDPLKELSVAAPKHGVKFGVYYSHIADWGHPGGSSGGPHWDPSYQDGDLDTYIDKVAVPQVKELLENYGPIGEFWFDNDGAPGMTTARANRFFAPFKAQPQVLINNRLVTGDFLTQEQHMTPQAPLKPWEVCLTLNGAWGYRNQPAGTLQSLLQRMVEGWSKGGNVLMNVGPKADGEFPADSIDRLRGIGAWMRVNGESIYGSTEGPLLCVPWGRTTLKGTTLYLHVFNWPTDGVLNIPVTTPVKRAYLLADRDKALTTSTKDGRLLIQLPATAPDPNVSVIAVELTAVPARVNPLTLDKPITADLDPKNAFKVVDNDPNNWWKAGKVSTATLTVDLQAPQTFNTLRLGSRLSKLKVTLEYLEGETWKTACSEAITKEVDEYVKTFPAVTAQHVRLTISEATNELTLTCFELFAP